MLPKTSRFAGLADHRADDIVTSESRSLARDAEAAQCDLRTLERQIRLHIPSPSCDLSGGTKSAYASVRAIAIGRASRIAESRRNAYVQADNYNFRSDMLATRRGLRTRDGRILPIEFRSVTPSIGNLYQADLHYLRAPRADTFLHFGAYEPDSAFPLFYMSFSRCDRPLLRTFIGNLFTGHHAENVIMLTRAVGVSDLAPNLISFALSKAFHHLSGIVGKATVVTAVNPFLGFTGASSLAAGFVPVALSPVRYTYESDGSYTTGRLASATARSTKAVWPPNILLTRSIDSRMQRQLLSSNMTIRQLPLLPKSELPADNIVPSHLTEVLPKMRLLLEGSWSSRTIHPDYADKFKPRNPVGQCGVSSVWLARRMRLEFGLESMYCYGDLEFDDYQIGAVRRHCWLEVDNGQSKEPIVIDLTADQAKNFAQRVIVAPKSELESRGIRYNWRIRKPLDRLPTDAVWSRFLILSDRVDTRNSLAA